MSCWTIKTNIMILAVRLVKSLKKCSAHFSIRMKMILRSSACLWLLKGSFCGFSKKADSSHHINRHIDATCRLFTLKILWSISRWRALRTSHRPRSPFPINYRRSCWAVELDARCCWIINRNCLANKALAKFAQIARRHHQVSHQLGALWFFLI